MVRTLDTILTEINALLDANLTYSPNVFYELSTLQTVDGRTFPMVRRSDKEARKISADDTKDMKFYHRLEGQEIESEGGKGDRIYTIMNHQLILTGVGFRRNVSTSDTWNNQDQAVEVMNILAKNPYLSGKEQIVLTGRPNTNKTEVLESEYAGNDRIKTKVLDLYAFQITYTVRQRVICLNS